MTEPRPACLDEGAVLAFLDGSLAAGRRAAVEEHIARCSACAELTTWVAADLANGERPAGLERFLGQLAPGSRVDRYQILGPIGHGGMGEVYAAYHPDLDRRIALKVVYESGAHSAERRARLLLEARAIARLSHPNVVTVHDAGTVGDRVYVAMELIDGETLDVWLKAAPRDWRAIVDVFVAAGRGLAAAHAAKLIHRDFKPQNVMIGKDGSVRVMDFGLVRLVGRELPADEIIDMVEPTPAAGADERVTRTGALLGTPAYMAPEQFRGKPIDARADQFSFCVALHEALYGTRPRLEHLPAPNGGERSGASDGGSGRVAPRSPTGPRASGGYRPPTWIRRIVARGLSADRDRRFESMDQLLSALDRGRRRLRRRLSLVVVGLAGAIVALGVWRSSRAPAFDCEAPRARVAAAWAPNAPNDPRRRAIERRMVVSGRDGTGNAWASFTAMLDAHIERWQAMYRDACEATHVRGEQSTDALDLRMSCLSQNLEEVRALTSVLERAESVAPSRAVTAAGNLTPVDRCANLALLRGVVPPPNDERTRSAVDRLRPSVMEVMALRELWRLTEGLTKAQAIRPAVEATGYKPLIAELLVALGMTESNVGTTLDAEKTLEQALLMAEASHDDVTAAKAAVALIFDVGYAQGRTEDGMRWARLATAILDRLGPGHERLRGWAVHNQANVLEVDGKLEEARALFQQALSYKRRAVGPDHPDVAITLDGLAQLLQDLGELPEALEAEDRAIDIFTRHGVATFSHLNNRGEILLALRRFPEAEAAFTRSLQGMEQELHSAEAHLAYPLSGLGVAKLEQGHADDALPLLERALQIRTHNQVAEITLADTQLALARALWETAGDRHRAIDLARKARASYASHSRAAGEKSAAEWLATHKKRG